VCRLAARLAALSACLFLGGCALGERAPQDPGATLRVTRDFGAERIAEERVPRATEHADAAALLDSVARVERAGGRVVAVDGVRARRGERWAPFVNGIDPGPGLPVVEGREDRLLRTLAPGDLVQWDLRAAAVSAPAIVGAFPRPLAGGAGGRRFPIRIECDDAASEACGLARRRLAEQGVPISVGSLGAPGGPTLVRLIVAPWPIARRVRALLPLAGDPRRSGAFARFGPAGLTLYDARARPRPAPPGTGLIAATRTGRDAPTWVLTGLDRRGVVAAARALDRRALTDRYAVAATPGGVRALPLE
jgi:hypothetical protein